MELKELKQIQNGMLPTDQPTIEEKVASGIGVEGTTGQSTLTDRKYIKNLPKFGDGLVSKINKWGNKNNAMFGSNAGAVMSAAPAAIDFVGSISSGTKYNKTADDLLQDAGSAEGNIGGVSYQTQNEIDAQQVAAQEHAENKANTIGLMGKGASLGASIGSVAGPVGGLIGGAVGAIGGLVGGLFGGGRRHAAMRRRIAEAQNRALRQNDFSRSGALTSVLQQNYAREYGDTESQSLYGFKDGKSTWSAAGSVGLGANARVSNGEIIANKYTGEMFRVPGLPNNEDGKLAFIRPSDTIISNKYGLSDYVASTGDLEGGEAMQGMIMKSLGKKGYKNGKLPGFAWGLPEWLNMATNSIGMISSLTDKSKIENEPISRPNTRKTNANASRALNIMAQQQYNPYTEYRDLYDVYNKNRYATNNNAGMSAAQRAVMNYAGYNDAMNSIAKVNRYAQDMNSKYAQGFAQMDAQLGEDQANRDMKSEQFDYNAYNQAHGAKMLMSSQRQYDAMNYLNNFTKGIIDMHNWRKMYNLYEEDVKNRKNNNFNTANTTKSWDDIYNDMGISKTADYADTTSDTAWTNAFRKKFNPTPLSEEERYARNIKNLGLNSLFYNPLPEIYMNPLKRISTRTNKKRKNK